MTQLIDRASWALVTELMTSAARSCFLAGFAAAALALFRIRSTSLRLFTWTFVLYASLALPLLGWLLPPLQVPAPEFLQHRMTLTTLPPAWHSQSVSTIAGGPAVRIPEIQDSGRPRHALVSTAPVAGTHGQSGTTQSSPWPDLAWNVIAAGIYLAVTLLFLGRIAAGVVLTSRLVRNSHPIPEAFPVAKLATQRRLLAASDFISVPVTVGAFRPTILLPSDWREWNAAKLSAVLAHELSHVARRDALTQRLSLLYRAIFWFNPLVWWLHQHVATLAEQASDEAALSGGADRAIYARTLLQFFETLQTSAGRIRWEGVSMARAGQAEQRLERILSWKGTVTMNLKKSLAVAILVLAIPVVYLAAAVRPAHWTAAVAMSQKPAPAPPSAPAAPPVDPVSSVAPIQGVPSVAPVAPPAPPAPGEPTGPEDAEIRFSQSHSSGTGHGRGFSYAYGFDDEERFVLVSGKSDSFTMSGSSIDARHVEKLKKQIPGDFIWFQRDEKSYIIRDQATVDRARGFWAGSDELGKKQEELGKEQEALGKQQGELGRRMEKVRVDVPDMTADLDRLKAKLQKLGPNATMEQVSELQSEMGELQGKMGEIQSQAGAQQGKLGELQGELGEKQGKLGERQGELGRQQAELAEKATLQMKGLLDEAIKNGTAKPEEEIVKSPTL